MRQIIVSTLSLLTVFTIASCKKDHQPAPPPPSQPQTIHINYIYLSSSQAMQLDSLKQIEVILSEPGGNILLDTIAAVNTPIIADIRTSRKLVDLSVIRYSAFAKSFTVYTQKAIAPGDWSVLYGSDSTLNVPPYVAPATTLATVFYTHVPAINLDRYGCSNYTGSSFASYLENGNHTFQTSFKRWPEDDVYFTLTNEGLYNFHHLTSAKDTIDLSKMDTAVKIRFHNRPAQYPRIQAIFLGGFTDLANTSKSLLVSTYNYTIPDSIIGADMMYPAKNSPFKKYNLNVTFSDMNNTTWSTYSDTWSDSVTSYPVILDDTYMSLTATDNNNFSVHFNKTAPGYYTTVWKSNRINISINTPPDSTLQMVDFLRSLKSQLLKNEDPTAIKPFQFSFSYQVRQGMQLVPVKPGPIDNIYHAINDKPAVVSYSRRFQ